jgi:hypothetical protein
MRTLESDVFQRLVHHQLPSLHSRYLFFVPVNLGAGQRLYHQMVMDLLFKRSGHKV